MTPATTPASSGAAATTPTVPTTAATTSPASNPYTARWVCGTAFTEIDSEPLRASDGTLLGRVHLLHNSANGRYCTTTLKASAVGTPTAATAYLEVQGWIRNIDSGFFKYYAGPAKGAAFDLCVKWGGSLDGVSYDSPFEHCD